MIEKADLDSKGRHVVLSVLIMTLVTSAGCSSLLTDDVSPSAVTEGPSQQETTVVNNGSANNTSNSVAIPTNGTDLRNISLPNDTHADTFYGEVDGGDPVLDGTNRYYEPVAFTGETDERINVSMSSIAGDPELQLRAPNGSTVALDNNDGDGNDAQLQIVRLDQTGEYTLVAASAEANSSFTYRLMVEHYIEPNFNGPMSSWDEESRYLEFSRDYLLVAQNLTGGIDGPRDEVTAAGAEGNLTAMGNYTVNTEEDYIIVGYAMERNATPYERIDVDGALQGSYWGLYNAYVNSDTAENASWVPERIYHQAYTYEGELYRTTYLELDWARQFYEAGGLANETAQAIYSSRYFATLRFGPAHQDYTEGGEYSTTPEEAPVETYENVTIDVQADNSTTARP